MPLPPIPVTPRSPRRSGGPAMSCDDPLPRSVPHIGANLPTQVISCRSRTRRYAMIPNALSREAHPSRPAPQATRLRSRWHRQHHGPCILDQVERHETPNPVRSDAVDPRFHCVRQRTDRDPWSGPNSGRDAVPSPLVTFVSADAPGSVAGPRVRPGYRTLPSNRHPEQQ